MSSSGSQSLRVVLFTAESMVNAGSWSLDPIAEVRNLVSRLTSRGIGAALLGSVSSQVSALFVQGLKRTSIFQDWENLDDAVIIKSTHGGFSLEEVLEKLQVMPLETALVGVSIREIREASNIGLGLVVALGRELDYNSFRIAGANLLVPNLYNLSVDVLERWMPPRPRIRPALTHLSKVWSGIKDRELVIFLSYEGALAPVVSRSEMAVLSHGMKEVIRELVGFYPTVILSERGRQDLASMVDLDGLCHVGSNGLDISGPGLASEFLSSTEIVAQIRLVTRELVSVLHEFPGVFVDPREVSVIVHLEQMEITLIKKIEGIVDKVLLQYRQLEKFHKQNILEIRSRLDCDRGEAVNRIKAALRKSHKRACSLYVGGCPADEKAFVALARQDFSVLVSRDNRTTAAHYHLQDPNELEAFLFSLLNHSRREKIVCHTAR